jgi:hypothetical protein
MSRHAFAAQLLCAMLLAACSKPPQDEGLPAPSDARTILSVDNQGFPDMTIYVINGSRRVRLGMANGNRVTELPIPPHLVRGLAQLRFLADPIGGSRAPVSEEITVGPGDEVTLTIPPS